jgi:hypothetical protein
MEKGARETRRSRLLRVRRSGRVEVNNSG